MSDETGSNDHQLHWSSSERGKEIGALFGAIAKAQLTIGKHPAMKDSTNPQYNSKFAPLENVQDACIPALAENGVAVIQLPFANSTRAGCTTIFGHADGGWMSCTVSLAMTDQRTPEIHRAGSAITYARRYSLAAMAGVRISDDDDGNAAAGPHTASPLGAKPAAAVATIAPSKDKIPKTRAELIGTGGKIAGLPLSEWPWKSLLSGLAVAESACATEKTSTPLRLAQRNLMREELNERISGCEGDEFQSVRHDMLEALQDDKLTPIHPLLRELCQ